VIGVFFLPFPLRGVIAPHLWVFYRAFTTLENRAFYIASADYFEDPENHRLLGRAETRADSASYQRYRIPSAEELDSLPKAIVPRELVTDYLEQFGADLKTAWRNYLTVSDPKLSGWIGQRIGELNAGGSRLEAVVTWSNCPSLESACLAAGIPVIHCELGPYRYPDYLGTTYFDLRGVNGNTEARVRYEAYQAAGEKRNFTPLAPSEIRHLLGARELPTTGKTYRVGVPLQVEDDSNVVAFASGMDTSTLLNWVSSQYSANDIVIRSHPASQLKYAGDKGVVDNSPSTADFLGSCDEIVTLNSSVAAEALLYQKTARTLGEASFSYVSEADKNSPESITRLDFFVLHYLVPEDLLFDEQYIRWRLTGPSEEQIRELHLQRYLNPSRHPPFRKELHESLHEVQITTVTLYIGAPGLQSIYSEANTVRERLPLSGTDYAISLPISPHPGGISALRLDPAECPCAVNLLRVEICDPEGRALWALSSPKDVRGLSDLLLQPTGRGGVGIVSLGQDPRFELAVPEVVLDTLATFGGTLNLLVQAFRLTPSMPASIVEILAGVWAAEIRPLRADVTLSAIKSDSEVRHMQETLAEIVDALSRKSEQTERWQVQFRNDHLHGLNDIHLQLDEQANTHSGLFQEQQEQLESQRTSLSGLQEQLRQISDESRDHRSEGANLRKSLDELSRKFEIEYHRLHDQLSSYQKEIGTTYLEPLQQLISAWRTDVSQLREEFEEQKAVTARHRQEIEQRTHMMDIALRNELSKLLTGFGEHLAESRENKLDIKHQLEALITEMRRNHETILYEHKQAKSTWEEERRAMQTDIAASLRQLQDIQSWAGFKLIAWFNNQKH